MQGMAPCARIAILIPEHPHSPALGGLLGDDVDDVLEDGAFLVHSRKLCRAAPAVVARVRKVLTNEWS